jgi:archaellum component FlaG (FlaF/FlaG flagellin family)
MIMADGGASTFIFLATALLVSGAVSAVLISQYGDITSAMEVERRENEADAKTSFEFAGDLANVAYNNDPVNPAETITFYLQNTGEYVLDESTLFVQLEGSVISSANVSSSLLPSGTSWGNINLLEVVLSGAWGFADNTDINLTVLIQSVLVGGYQGEDVESTVVRLNEL